MANRSIGQRVRSLTQTRAQAPSRQRSQSVSLVSNWAQQYALSVGYRNDRTGAGGANDHTRGGSFQSTELDRISLEKIYATSWAARKFINIPIDDAFVRWRAFDDDAETMEGAEIEHHVKEHLAATLRNARLIGTGLLVMLTADNVTEEPLEVDDLREGDLNNIVVVDKWDAHIAETYDDPFDPQFGKPRIYDIHLNNITLSVHESRVIRIDGVEPPGGRTWQHREDWGISELEAVLPVIFQDASFANSVSHLTEEASVTILKMQQFREALSGQVDTDEERADWQTVLNTNIGMKSNYRTVVMDAEDDISRLAVTFTGLPELQDRLARRLAAAANIPATRFWGQSPLGMNATGESDLINYAMTVAAYQTQKIDPALQKLDMVLAKDAGLDEPPIYEWRSLIDLSDKDSAQISQIKSTVVTSLIAEGVIDEEEGRAILSGDTMIGELSEELPEILREAREAPDIPEIMAPAPNPMLGSGDSGEDSDE